MTKTKFTSSYIYITNISYITQSDKGNIFDKTKTIRPKIWSIGFTKKSLMTYHWPKTSVHRLLSQFSPHILLSWSRSPTLFLYR